MMLSGAHRIEGKQSAENRIDARRFKKIDYDATNSFVGLSRWRIVISDPLGFSFIETKPSAGPFVAE